MDYNGVYRLAEEIKRSDEYKAYHDIKDDVMTDETTAALIKEYRKLQVTLQVDAMNGHSPDETDMQRFQGISALLFGKPSVSQFLLSEMRLQQMVGDVFKIIADASGLQMDIPGF